jgi:hypothetical protein
MIIVTNSKLQERQRLNEMSIRVISSPEENLPFKVTIKCPDKGNLDHAHIMKLRTQADEIGAFVITKNSPKSIEDFIGYTEGKHKGLSNFTDDQLRSLVDWVSRRNSLYPETNWQALQYEYAVNQTLKLSLNIYRRPGNAAF